MRVKREPRTRQVIVLKAQYDRNDQCSTEGSLDNSQYDDQRSDKSYLTSNHMTF